MWQAPGVAKERRFRAGADAYARALAGVSTESHAFVTDSDTAINDQSSSFWLQPYGQFAARASDQNVRNLAS